MYQTKFFFFILNLFLLKSFALKCGEEEIENCLECGTRDKINTCAKCLDKYYLTFNNLFCIPCDDPLNGQIGCGGTCYLNKKHKLICNKKECKDGFLYLNGTCINCTVELPGCKTCSYLKNQYGVEVLKCTKCLDTYEYELQNGKCIHYIINFSNKYLYDIYDKSLSEECQNNYYLRKDDKVERYKLCSTSCHCIKGYIKINKSICVRCPNNCAICKYNKETDRAECEKCELGFALNKYKSCTNCGVGCNICSLSDDLTPICNLCIYGDHYKLLKNGTCAIRPYNCISWNITNNDDIICSNCEYTYYLNNKNKCVKCASENDNGMKGCKRCGYNRDTQNLECYECFSAYAKVINVINNTLECFDNSYNSKPEFYGCEKAYKKGGKYECFECIYTKNNLFVMDIKGKRCLNSVIHSFGKCREVENIGTEKRPLYSCTKCPYDYALVSSNNKKFCHERNGYLSFCLEGQKDKYYNYKCTKCVSNAKFNSRMICECDSYSFSETKGICYRCDDRRYGGSGCLAEKGCKYNNSTQRLNCKECKDGYYKYLNECLSCFFEINFCAKCHYYFIYKTVICDECFEGYIYNSEKKECELINCELYPEISEGCLICEGKREEYLLNKKCHFCKEGYFKTKDGLCTYCRRYGGPDCNNCIYDFDENGKETNNIKCKDCNQVNYLLSSDGKCFNCKNRFPNCEKCEFIKSNDNIEKLVCSRCMLEYYLNSDGKCYKCKNKIQNCELCEIIKNNNNTEKLSCTLCIPGYYRNSEGKCIYYLNNLKSIKNCHRYFYKINDVEFCYYESNNTYSAYYCNKGRSGYYNDYSSYSDYLKFNDNFFDFKIPKINYPKERKCIECSIGYNLEFLNTEWKCIKINCSLISIVDEFPNNFYLCSRLCNSNKYKYLEIPYINITNNNTIEIFDPLIFFYDHCPNNYNYFYLTNDIINFNDIIDYLDDMIKPLLGGNNLCIKINDSFNNLEYCGRVRYDEDTKTYKCSKCLNDSYILDIKTNTCIKNYYNCIFENNICTKCFDDNYLLVTNEKNEKYCVYKNDSEEIKYCLEANSVTKYVNTTYNCNKCSKNFVPYYSKFFERKICQSIYYKQIKENNIIPWEKYNEVEYIEINDKYYNEIKNLKNFFTPDGKRFYQCNNEYIGMPGCKGACNFSSKRKDFLKCEEGCEIGYIEIKEGLCESCQNINKGCYQCHYENNFPEIYYKIKRERRFVCDFCEEGFELVDGECSKISKCDYSSLNFCDEIKIVELENIYNDDIFLKFKNHFLFSGEDEKEKYELDNIFINNNKFYFCSDVNNGGIDKCKFCERNEQNKLICQICESDYILLVNNNSCLNIAENKELEKYDSCEKLGLDNNNQLYCIKCKKEYSLLKLNYNDKGKCIKLPILYDYYYEQKFFNIGQLISIGPRYTYYREEEEDSDNGLYYYERYQNYPCQEAVNLGTPEKPLYSCNKCYTPFEFEKSYYKQNNYTKIINSRNKAAFCVKPNKLLKYCIEALIKIKNGIQIFDCVKCSGVNQLIYNAKKDINYCLYVDKNKKCTVKYCKTCKKNNINFCDKCLLSNYEVNRISGQCVEKLEEVPAINWEDIFGFKMYGIYEKNNQIFNGPKLRIRGITTYKIKKGHAFLIYLTFKKKYTWRKIKNLEYKNSIILSSICEIKNIIKRNSDDLCIVDYECVSNSDIKENLINYKLEKIEEGENRGILKKSNINELTIGKNMNNFMKKNSVYKIIDFMKTLNFKIKKLENQKAKENIFDFILEGKLNKDNAKYPIKGKLELNEVNDKINCEITKENLQCRLEVNYYKNISLFTFKAYKLEGSTSIYISNLDKICLLNEPNDVNSKSKSSLKLILLCISVGVAFIGIIIAIYFYICNTSKPSYLKIKPKKIKKY